MPNTDTTERVPPRARMPTAPTSPAAREIRLRCGRNLIRTVLHEIPSEMNSRYRNPAAQRTRKLASTFWPSGAATLPAPQTASTHAAANGTKPNGTRARAATAVRRTRAPVRPSSWQHHLNVKMSKARRFHLVLHFSESLPILA